MSGPPNELLKVRRLLLALALLLSNSAVASGVVEPGIDEIWRTALSEARDPSWDAAVDSHASSLRVSDDLAAELIARQLELVTVLERMIPAVGNRLAGAGLDSTAQGVAAWLAVVDTASLPSEVMDLARQNGVELRLGQLHSLDHLISVANDMARDPDVAHVAVDERANSLLIALRDNRGDVQRLRGLAGSVQLQFEKRSSSRRQP